MTFTYFFDRRFFSRRLLLAASLASAFSFGTLSTVRSASRNFFSSDIGVSLRKSHESSVVLSRQDAIGESFADDPAQASEKAAGIIAPPLVEAESLFRGVAEQVEWCDGDMRAFQAA